MTESSTKGNRGQKNPKNKPDKKNEEKPGRPKGDMMPLLGRLGRYMLTYRWIYVLLFFGFGLSTILSLAPAWLIRIALDEYLTPEGLRQIWIIAGLMLGAAVLQGVVDYLTRYTAETTGQKIVYKIRQKCYRHLLKLPFSYYDQSRTGDIMSRVTADAQTLQWFFGYSIVHLMNNSLFLIGVFIVMFMWSYQLALLYMAILPFVIFGITRYAFVVRPAYARTRRRLGELTNSIQEQLQGIQVIKLFGHENEASDSVSEMNEEYLEANLEAGKITSFWMPFVTVLIGISTGFIVWYAGRGVIEGNITLGMLVGFTTYIGMLMRPVRQTGMLVGQVINSSASAERIFGVMDTEPEVRDLPDAEDAEKLFGKVSYENVSFGYEDEKLVLKDISFEVKPGETVAIVGPTGAGKSTLIHLLPRFYDINKGRISIDDRDIRNLTLDSLRRHIGIVLQHTFLFNLSIRENIAFGRPDAGLEEIREAAEAAEIDDFIMTLPHKYDEQVGDRGVKLSGGQRQRLNIARTLLMDPPILILDEPTSSVDATTDEKIQRAIGRLCKNRTVFVIAHRLWTIQNADRILVLNQGKMEQFGEPKELIERPGLFREIYSLQVDSEKFDFTQNAALNQEGGMD